MKANGKNKAARVTASILIVDIFRSRTLHMRLAFFKADTQIIMQLPSSELSPLQLCRELVSLSVCGAGITDLDFIANLPKLAELTVDGAQVRDLSPLATLPSLRKLAITNMDLRGGGEVDLTVLGRMSTLEEVSFKGSSAVSTISRWPRLPVCASLT